VARPSDKAGSDSSSRCVPARSSRTPRPARCHSAGIFSRPPLFKRMSTRTSQGKTARQRSARKAHDETAAEIEMQDQCDALCTQRFGSAGCAVFWHQIIPMTITAPIRLGRKTWPTRSASPAPFSTKVPRSVNRDHQAKAITDFAPDPEPEKPRAQASHSPIIAAIMQKAQQRTIK